jgi:uncharacterized protein (DUF1786 family)
MRILAIDIGAGTQDILLFDTGENIENCTSLVLPAPSRIFAKKLSALKNNVYIQGDTTGGGAPGGNTMMTGPVGLVKAALFRLDSFQDRD